MSGRGIECHGFGFSSDVMPAEGFELEKSLKASAVFLPVHQSLSDREIDMIATLVNEWNAQHC